MQKEIYEFISKQTNDPIIERRTCTISWTPFPVYQSEKEYFTKRSVIFAGQTFSIPLPDRNDHERLKARLIFRNERKLYRRTCDKTGKSIISNYAPDKAYTVYDKEYRWSDNRDAIQYGQDIDYNRLFFAQFDELLHKVPRTSAIVVSAENSDYNNNVGYVKNSYLCFDNGRLEDCLYNARSYYNKKSIDILAGSHNELSYELIDCSYCTKCFSSQNLDKCYNCRRSYNCQWCNNCFLCTNLVNQSYCIKNQQYTKEAYEEEVAKIKTHWPVYIAQEFEQIKNSSIHRTTDNISCEKVIWSHMKNCKNTFFTIGSQDTQDSRYCYDHIGWENNYDDIFGGNCKNCYHILGCESTSNSMFCISCRAGSTNLLYCDFCHSCQDCFGCVWLRNKQYCIYNKQYSKETYEQEVARLIAHMIQTNEWGQFFPKQLSPFAYNESTIYEYFPCEREEALSKGYQRLDKEEPINIPSWMQTLQANQIPPIQEVDDSILQTAIICSVSGKPFRVVNDELNFYRTHNIQIPHIHPDRRHYARLQKKSGRKLYLRTCDKTGELMLSMYPSNTTFPVYNEKSYDQQVYW